MESWPHALVAVFLIGMLVMKYGLVFVRSKSDAPRIKRDYEANGARVVSLEPAGFELGGRSSPSYRKYEIVVDHPYKGRQRYLVGVEVALLSDPGLKAY